ncbi:MAG: hypothetical protein IJE97_03575 [Thermoguttaceae bacterium]|nr:hypothetical protein [Thermoguttaceae bacterium]MBQ7112479.1 hypothetical protein [Thermoguttaceae bacterium]
MVPRFFPLPFADGERSVDGKRGDAISNGEGGVLGVGFLVLSSSFFELFPG